ncbi:hypothetical protein BLOT_000052 [Blomia tropicalis]|nr:hypothetical protein BLOT_000052 [Blomia tropicalis]
MPSPSPPIKPDIADSTLDIPYRHNNYSKNPSFGRLLENTLICLHSIRKVLSRSYKNFIQLHSNFNRQQIRLEIGTYSLRNVKARIGRFACIINDHHLRIGWMQNSNLNYMGGESSIISA